MEKILIYCLWTVGLSALVLLPFIFWLSKVLKFTMDSRDTGRVLSALVCLFLCPSLLMLVMELYLPRHGCDMGIECIFNFFISAPATILICVPFAIWWFNRCWLWKNERQK
jgi:hypothetical protein